MNDTEVVIVAARRTPIGAFQGALAPVTAPVLGAVAIRAALDDAGIEGAAVDEVLMGCVLPAGQGQAPARQAALAAGLPVATGCTTVNKVCGSGMKTAMIACDAIRSGALEIAVAGGMESMTNSPYILPKARSGYRMGHGELLDHMFYDGLQNAYDQQAMGHFAEATARRYGFDRLAQDEYARQSVERAIAAEDGGHFEAEVAPVTVRTRKAETVVSEDEEPRRMHVERIPTLRPAFEADGTVTAASSSKISDGAAAVVLISAQAAERHGLKPLARVVGHATHSQEPEWFTTAPVGAVRKLTERIGWTRADVDLYEINEAFAVVTMAAIHDLDLDPGRVNVNGGACALGHPIGCSGARILVTLLHALRRRGGVRGIASLCLGGGEATAIAVELMDG